MDAQEADITERVNHFIDAFVDRGECDFSEEFAELLPSSVFLGLMGLPWDELDTFLHLRDGILRPDKLDANAMYDGDTRIAVQRATGRELYAYFDKVCDARQQHPSDDIMSHLVTVDIDGEKLSREEILDICFLFLIAGLDTVSDSLTCFYAFLANNPEHRRRLVADPTLIPGAVEELLRWESPVPAGVPRIATQDTELPNGIKVAAGTAVMVSYGAANVDPAEFDDPFDVRFDREANRHIAFGARCAPLPRLTPRAAGAPHRAARMAPADSRVFDQARPRGARLHARAALGAEPHAHVGAVTCSERPELHWLCMTPLSA